jgi:predicted phage terminase large subunit-like protein
MIVTNIQQFHKMATFLTLQDSVSVDDLSIPQLHYHLLDHYQSDDRLVGVVCPVGFAKSSTLKNYGLKEFLENEKFVIYCTSTHKKAKAQMTSISYLLNNKTMQTLYNYKLLIDNETEIVIEINDGKNIKRKKFLAISYGTDISGINFEGARPSLILIDDIEELSTANSLELTEKLLTWIKATLISRLPSLRDGKVRLIGTNLSQISIINQLINEKIRGWKTYKYTCYNDEGNSWWENQHPTELLKKEEMEDPTIFAMNYLNAPLDLTNSRIKAHHLRYYTELPAGVTIVDASMHYDLTHTAKTTSDYSCIVLVCKGSDNLFYVMDWHLAKDLDPEKQAEFVLQFYLKHKSKNIRKLTYDATANDGFGRWSKKMALEKDISLPLEGVKYNKDKDQHLTEHEPHFVANRLYFNSEHQQLDLATTQMLSFPAGKHDDFLDALLGALDYWKIEHSEQITESAKLQNDETLYTTYNSTDTLY